MPVRKAINLWILVLCLTGCTLVGAPQEASPHPGPVPPQGSPVSGAPSASDAEASTEAAFDPDAGDEAIAMGVVETAFEAIGTPYEWGGNDGNGFDCSGLIRYAYGRYGIDLPRVSRDQLREGIPVEKRVEALLPGDILGFSAVPGGESTHVGLFVGDGRFIHSSSSGVRVSNLRDPYWQRHFIGARRIVY